MSDILFDKLCSHDQITDTECFELIQDISRFLNSSNKDENQKGRNLIIRILDNWENISTNYKRILIDLISAAGFYPYLKRMNLIAEDLISNIQLEYHKSPNLNNSYYHSEQKKLSDLILSHTNVIASAPTSFGKSMLIEEIVASKEYKNILIIQPTLALLDETRKKLKKYSSSYKIIVKTTQPFSNEKGNIFLLTAERVLEYKNMPQIGILILDEFYKLSDSRGDNRNNILNTAFIRVMKNPECRFYMLGPNVDSIPKGFVEKYEAVFFKTNFSMVFTEEDNRYEAVRIKRGGKVDENDVFALLDDLNEQTLIYCASPSAARKLAFLYCAHIEKDSTISVIDLPLISWINDNLSYRWSLSKCLQYGIGIHDGAMPKHITSSTIQYFNDRRIKYLFCTNTIIEGVNTSAKNVVYCDKKIGPRKVDYFDYANIRGRAGRLMEHYVGRIINLQKPPVPQETHVDFPFYEQNPIASEILVNLAPDDVLDINDNIKRYNEFKEKDPELQEILIRNGVSIEGQFNILNRLFNDLQIPIYRENIIWNRIDAKLYKRLQYIFDLCWNNLATPEEIKSFGPKGWVVNKIVSSCYRTSISQMIDHDIEFKAKKLAEEKGVRFESIDQMFKLYPIEMQQRTDGIIEKIFALQKNWLQYRAPKWINVVDSLQKYATLKLELPSGDYSYIAEMIENEFIQSNLQILLEFGIPQSAVKKIQIILQMYKININNTSEDDLLSFVSEHLTDFEKYLSEYEIDILKRSI